MKKLLFILLAIILLISGCGANMSVATTRADVNTTTITTVNTSTTVTATTTTETVSTSTSAVSLEAKLLSSSKTNPEMKVHYIDVGQSDCILVELPNGENMMIDAGSNSSEQTVMDYLHDKNITSLKYVFGTHPHEDHIGSLDAILHSLKIGNLYLPDATHNTQAYEDVISAIDINGYYAKTPEVGGLIINDQDLQLYMRVMAPASEEYVDLNNYSIVLKLAYVDVSFLFTGDAEDILEYEMIDSGLNLDVDVLKVGHHGSDTSTSEAFLMATTPQYAVISVGEDNKYGHPSESVIEKLNNAGVEIYRTDERGTIVALTDGYTISFEFEKEFTEPVVTTTATTTEETTTVTTAATTKETTTAAAIPVIGNKNSKIFHSTTCRSLPKESNRVNFNSRDSAIKSGYTPCKICNP